MTNSTAILRTLLIYSICLPLAIFVGYLIASPDPTRDYSTYFGVGLVLFLLFLPVLLRWHRLLLVISWNALVVLYFLPGRPELFLAFAWLSLLISVVQFIINPRSRFLSVPSVSRPLVVLGIIVIATAAVNGGIGFGTFGSETMGGKKYLTMLTGIVAFFALISQPIPPRKATLYVILFFLGSLTCLIGELGSVVAPGFYFIFWLFPISQQSVSTILANPGMTESIDRFAGVAFAGSAVVLAMLARYGVRELFDPRRLPRLVIFVGIACVSLVGGFRSVLITLTLTFAVMFYLEGLTRSRLLPLLLLLVALGGALIAGFAHRLPLNIQRTLTIVPGLELDPLARRSAEDSSRWRLEMWQDVLPQVPRYLLLGRGFALTGAELRANISGRPGDVQQFSAEGSASAGDFHNGPLSLIIPFGIWGVIAFVWFIIAALRVLYRNYQFGPPDLRKLNRFLFAVFLVKAFFFFFIFGSSYSDLAMFTGILGLSIAFNGGVAKPLVVPQPVQRQPLRFRPQLRKPASAV